MLDPLSPEDANSNSGASVQIHEAAGRRVGPLAFAVLTLSDTRDEQSDASGRSIREMVAAAGHRVVRHAIVREDVALIERAVLECVEDPEVQVLVTSGGTGVSLRDNACTAITGLLERRLEGFGELFRMLSYAEVGPAAMLSGALAGIARGKCVFAVPGSTKAVRLAMDKLILPQAGHLYYELHKQAS